MLHQSTVVVIQQQLQANLFLVGLVKLNVLLEAKKDPRAPPGSYLVMDNQPRPVSKIVRTSNISAAKSEHFDLKPPKVKTVSMGKNCMLQDDLYCGVGVPPVTHHCGCPNEVAMFKDVKCVGDNVYSCTGMC